jgi:hypothetical protein
MNSLDGFQCGTCGKWHDGLPLDIGFAAPHYWSKSLEEDPESYLTPDFCVIKNVAFFVRGVVEIPVVGLNEPFRWGAWTSLSRANFEKILHLWHDDRLLTEPPFFGWFSNSIKLYPETLNLKTNLISKDIKHRPSIILEVAQHLLSIEQRTGITIDRVRQIAESWMHPPVQN